MRKDVRNVKVSHLLYPSMVVVANSVIKDSDVSVRIALSVGQEMTFYIPQRSVVVINCTAENSLNPVWSIRLPGQNNPIQFTHEASIRMLNSLGFQKLEAVDSGLLKIIQLLINTTMINDGTVVGCDNAALGKTIAQTTLEIFSKCQNLYWPRCPVPWI